MAIGAMLAPLSLGEAENQSGSVSMHTAARNSLVLTDSSSLKRFADTETSISYGGFYQLIASRLTGSVQAHQFADEIGTRLVVLAEQYYAFRRMSHLDQLSQALTTLPLSRQYEAVGWYYQALCIQRFGSGDVQQAARLFERAAESASPTYRARALQSLGSNSYHRGDYQSARLLYGEADRFVSRAQICDPYTTLAAQKMVAVIDSIEGNHRDGLALLENLFPLARALRSSQPHVYNDYLNSLAVELCEVGRLEEARLVSQTVLASPFASAYPECRETRDEIERKGLRASRSIVAPGSTITDASLSQPTAQTSVSPAPLEGGNLVRLPLTHRDESPETFPAHEPARVFSIQDWKDKIAKQLNDNSFKRSQKPTTGKEKTARLEELEKLTPREMLMKIMDNLGDERVGEALLRRVLMILEDLEPDEIHGA